MARIKYIGKSLRMIGGTFMHQGDVRDVNPKIAKDLIGDANFVITWGEEEIKPAAVIIEVVTPEPVYESAPDLPFEIAEEPIRKVSKRGRKK